MIKAIGALCEQCTLHDAPFVPSSGSPEASIIIIGEAPGATEVEQQKPFVGQSGKLLDAALKQTGFDLEDVYRMNVVGCRPPQNAEPSEQEVQCCSGRVLRELMACKSNKMVTLGRVAKNTFLEDSAERGVWHPWRHEKMILPTWHPAYVLRKPSEGTTLLKDIAKAVSPQIHVGWTMPRMQEVTTLEELDKALCSAPNNANVAFDLETDNVNWYAKNGNSADAILAMAISWDPTWGIAMNDLMLYDTPGVPQRLQQMFDDKRKTFLAHNGKFDVVFMRSAFGVYGHVDFDTMLAHYILDENSLHGLKPLSQELLDAPDYEKEVQKYLRSKNDSYSKVPLEVLMPYGVADVCNTWQLHSIFLDQLKRNNQYEWPFQHIIMPIQQKFVDVEFRGMKVDVPHLQAWGRRMEREMVELTARGRDMCGLSDLNMNSTQQLADVIYGQFSLKRPRPPLKPNSTAHDAIEHLIGHHPFIDLLVKYRRIAKLKSSYIDNILEAVDPNGRVHANFLVHGTEVARISIRDPALQTIPRSVEKWDPKLEEMVFVEPYGAAIRSGFIAEEGNSLGIADYSQAELRALAVLSSDPFLMKVYQDGRDLHSEVATAMFGPNYTKEQRVMCKMFNFAYAYGGSEHSFANDAGLPLSVAIEFVRSYDKNMPVAKQWKLDQLKRMKEDGFVETPFHRRRHFPFITTLNVDDARKSAVHMPVAGSAGDLTLLSLIDAENEGIPTVLTVHDSILAEVAEKDVEEAAREIVKLMEKNGNTYMPQVPWKADWEVSKRWVPAPPLE